jgi:hypothetical protein
MNVSRKKIFEIPSVSTTYFLYDKFTMNFTADISELPAEFQNNFFEDGFYMESEKTYRVATFKISSVDENILDEIVEWNYVCETDGCTDIKCTIYNV